MSTAATTLMPPRFSSAADVSALTGLSVKTIRRRVKDGTIRGVKLGRRVLIPLDAIDRPAPRADDYRPQTQEAPPWPPSTTRKPDPRRPAGSSP